MKEAVCVLTNGKVKGCIEFKEVEDRVKITIKLENIEPGLHGFHIHRTGDLRQGCKTLCDHYNPFKTNHGGKRCKVRHVGDLGNIKADKNGKVNTVMYDSIIKLSGKYSIIGRSVVIHEKKDDLGRGNNKESLITGNAGKRIGCGVIGLTGNC